MKTFRKITKPESEGELENDCRFHQSWRDRMMFLKILLHLTVSVTARPRKLCYSPLLQPCTPPRPRDPQSFNIIRTTIITCVTFISRMSHNLNISIIRGLVELYEVTVTIPLQRRLNSHSCSTALEILLQLIGS
jgi:hypothetical protein